MSGSAFAVTHHAFSSGAGRTSDGNGSHASTLKSPSYTKSVSWQHYQGGVSLYTSPVITSYRYTHYDSSDAGGSYSNMISVRLNDPRGTGYTQLWLSRGTGAYTYDWTPETRYGSMKSVSLQRIQPLTEQLNLGLTAGKVWYDTPTDDFNGLHRAARLTWKF